MTSLPAFFIVVFGVGSWLGLTGFLCLVLSHLRPAWASGDPAGLTAGLLLGPMALYLVQGLWYVPRRPVGRPVFIRPRLFRFPVVFLFWPTAGNLETGPALEAVSPPEEQAILLAEAAARLAGRTLIPRLALLLEARSPLDILLGARAMGTRPAIAAWPARLAYLVMGPARQFLRVWGYVFFRLWAARSDPGPADALTDHRRRVAFDLDWRAARLFPDSTASRPDQTEDGPTRACLAGILTALRRVYNRDDYGREFSPVSGLRPDGPEAAGQSESLYAAPYLAPRYYGVYLDQPVTLAARTVDDLYDQGGEDSPSVFYPPELGEEVVRAALLAAERRRLEKLLGGRRVEGLMWMDGRPVLTWQAESAMADLDDQIAHWKKRVAAHHRRCRSSHLAAARRLGHGWPEALRGLAGLTHFAEHSRQALRLAAKDFARARDMESAEALFTMIRDVGDRLTRLAAPPELEIRGWAAASASNVTAPAECGLERWGEYGPPAARGLVRALEDLKDKALTALVAAEDELDRLGAEGAAAAPPAPPVLEPEPGYPVLPPRPPAAPARVYAPAERLKAGFGRTSLAALILALLCWQGWDAALSRLTAYNGLGREVVVTVDGRSVSLKPFSHAFWRLQPGRTCHVLTTADGRQVEAFSQTLAPLPGEEIYNVAGAAPLMEWRMPAPEAGEEAAADRFLGRPRWLTTRATVLFRRPEGVDELALSGYGDLSPAEMLAAFVDDQDRLALIDLHARWDSPLSPWFWDWRALAPEETAAAILLQRVASEPDFLDLCVRRLEGTAELE